MKSVFRFITCVFLTMIAMAAILGLICGFACLICIMFGVVFNWRLAGIVCVIALIIYSIVR